VCLLRGPFCTQSVFLCFYNRGCVYCAVRSAEAMYLWANILLYSIKWLVSINVNECVYCAVRSVHTMYLCVLWGSENKQRLFHCTELMNWILKLKIVCLLRGMFCPHSVFMCYAWTWEQTVIISLYSIDCSYNRDEVCLLSGTFCRNIVFMSHYLTLKH
jgi:hypothetical protein